MGKGCSDIALNGSSYGSHKFSGQETKVRSLRAWVRRVTLHMQNTCLPVREREVVQ